MGFDAAKFLAMAAVVLGLVIFVVLLQLTFGAPAILASAQGGRRSVKVGRCREDRPSRFAQR